MENYAVAIKKNNYEGVRTTVLEQSHFSYFPESCFFITNIKIEKHTHFLYTPY